MNRKETINFCNENIFPQVDIMDWTGYNGELFNVVRMVEKWRIGKNINTEMTAKVLNGFLFINNEKVGRIALPHGTRTTRYKYNNYTACTDYEGMILARAENYYD